MRFFAKNIVIAISVVAVATICGCSKQEVVFDEEITQKQESVEAIETPVQTPEVTKPPAQKDATIEKVELAKEPVVTEKPDSIDNNYVSKSNEETFEEEEKQLTCTMQVSCSKILENIDKFDPQKVEFVPEDGIIFKKQTVNFSEGESVFDVLKREMQENKIHLEFSITPGFNTAYIEGINNIYEFDYGDMSGWTYLVNGEMKGVGCSQCILKDGDIVEWVYTLGLE